MKKFNKNGFTLMEVIIYTSIFAIVGGLMTGILLTVTQVQQRESASAEVTGQLNFVMQTINRLVRESSNIEIETATTTSILKLRMQDTAKDPTCVSLVSGVIKLAEGPGTNPNDCTTDTSDLTSDRVVVDTFNFKKFVQYPGHDTVSLDIVMTYNSQNPKSRVQRTLSSAIARVSAATFDSNLLPGSTSFTVGQAGSTWQNVFVGDGSASNPSYSFGADTNVGIFRPGADILGFTTNSAERMRIDASGNVGIGTTDIEAWSSAYGAIQFPVDAIQFHKTASVIALAGNTSYYDGAYKRRTAAEAAQYIINTGTHEFRVAGSGIIDSAITWTSAMYINNAGNVGIGTTSPAANAKLDVNGEFYSHGTNGTIDTSGTAEPTYTATGVLLKSSVTRPYIVLKTGTSDSGSGLIVMDSSANYRLFVRSDGNVGIGTTDPGTIRLYVTGGVSDNWRMYVGGGGYGIYAIGTAFAAYFQGPGYLSTAAWIYGSDKRMKENITYFDNGMDKIMQLEPAKFDYINGQKEQLGFIAQDVQSIIPEAVVIADEKTGMLGLKTDFIIPYMVNAIKALGSKVTPLTDVLSVGNGSISINGNVGIGTTSPAYKLDVNGTIRAQGVILTSPNGTCYRLTISDAGALNTASITCP